MIAKRIIASVLLLNIGGCGTLSKKVMLDDQPWPVYSNGQYAEGTTTVLLLLNYHGVPVEACIAQSSGNSEFDQLAIPRALTYTYLPTRRDGWPIEAYVREPIHFSAAKKSAVVESPEATNVAVCRTQRLVNVPANEAALIHHPIVTIEPTGSGHVFQDKAAWNGR